MKKSIYILFSLLVLFFSCQKPVQPVSSDSSQEEVTPVDPEDGGDGEDGGDPETDDPQTPDYSSWKIEYLGTQTENGSSAEAFLVSGTGDEGFYFFVTYSGFMGQLENNIDYFYATAEQYYQRDCESQGAESLLVKEDPCTLYYSELNPGDYEAYIVGLTEAGEHTGPWAKISFTKEGVGIPEDLTSLTLMEDWGVTYLRTQEETATAGVNWADVFSVQAPGSRWLEIMEVSDMIMTYYYGGSVLEFVNSLQYSYYDRYYADWHGRESDFFYTDGGREWRAEHVDGTAKYYLVEFDDNWHCTGRYGMSELDIPYLENY